MKKKDIVLANADRMSFPQDLLVPQSSQVQIYEDKVSSRIREIDAAASQLARGFGIGYAPGLYIDGIPERSGKPTLDLLAVAFLPRQRVSLEKVNSAWGLVYSYEPAPMRAANDRALRVPLRDAPLEVREKFLQRSEEFFRRYLATCGDRLGSMKTAVDAGDRTLSLLRSIELT